MRNRLVALTLLAAGCTSHHNAALRPTHDDRWRAASAAFERDLAQRDASSQATGAADARAADEVALASAPQRPAPR